MQYKDMEILQFAISIRIGDEYKSNGIKNKILFSEKIKNMNTAFPYSFDGATVQAYNSEDEFDKAAHIISVSFEGVRSEVLLHALEDKGIYVSAGSACASNKPAISETLKGIGVKKDLLDSTIRFSFSYNTKQDEIDYCLQKLNEIDRKSVV